MQQGVSSHYTDRHLWGFWKKQFKYRSLARLLITNYLFMFEAYFPQCCFGMFTQMVLCSSLEHLFTNTSTTFMKLHDPAWTVPDLRIVLTFLQKKTLKQTKNKQTKQPEWTHMRPRRQSGSSWRSARLGPRCRRWALPGRSTAPPTHAPDGSCSSSGPPCMTRGKQTPPQPPLQTTSQNRARVQLEIWLQQRNLICFCTEFGLIK